MQTLIQQKIERAVTNGRGVLPDEFLSHLVLSDKVRVLYDTIVRNEAIYLGGLKGLLLLKELEWANHNVKQIPPNELDSLVKEATQFVSGIERKLQTALPEGDYKTATREFRKLSKEIIKDGDFENISFKNPSDGKYGIQVLARRYRRQGDTDDGREYGGFNAPDGRISFILRGNPLDVGYGLAFVDEDECPVITKFGSDILDRERNIDPYLRSYNSFKREVEKVSSQLGFIYNGRKAQKKNILADSTFLLELFNLAENYVTNVNETYSFQNR